MEINDNIYYDYKKNIEEATLLLKSQCESFEEKLELFEKLYEHLSECYPIELRKIRLHSVNKLNGAIDKQYLRKYQQKGYLDLNMNTIASFIEGKRKALNIGSCNDLFYVKTICISKFRSITDMTLHFTKGINVLIGDNGVGKTSILDAIAISLRDTIGSFNITQKKFSTNDISVGYENTTIECIVSDGKDEYTAFHGMNTHRNRVLFSLNPLEKKEDAKILSEYLNDKILYPIISYHCISTGTQKNAYKTKKYDSMQGYAGCLNGRADIQLVTNWLETVESYVKEKYFNIINDFINMISSNKYGIVGYENKEIVYTMEDNTTIPLSYMSSGFQTILNLVMDVAYRLVVLNPHIIEPTKMFGVVLIDEIELHLHPKWQWKVLRCLEKTFPKIQFIVSTHSPMIISSCEKCNLISLTRNSKGEVEYSIPSTNGLYGKAIEDVLVYNMSSERIPSKLREDFEEFQKHYTLGDYESANRKLNEMQKKYGEDNGTVQKANFLLNLSFDED